MSDPIKVRMYNIGFGDCFLLRFPAKEGPRTMLIDCGEHTSSKSQFELRDVIGALMTDITDDQGNMRLDIVVISHRHQDHVKGFEDPRWADVEVGEVWMPWTEDPDDPEARSLLERQSSGSKKLKELAAEGSDAYRVALNSLTNEDAMATLHTGFAGSPLRRFFPQRPPETDSATLFPFVQSPVLPGVSVRLLGPSRDEAVIRQMDPPELERYLADSSGRVREHGVPLPFDRWRISQARFQQTKKYAHLDLRGLGDVVAAGKEDPYLLAVAIEQTVNNTSLMLLIQFAAAWLLFPGDSQWGSWDRVLQSEEGRELLARTTFYKVGHHGSHNATPRTFVEELVRGARAMVSVAPTGIPSWANIPKAALLEALTKDERCELLVNSNDLGKVRGDVVVERGGMVAEVLVPT